MAAGGIIMMLFNGAASSIRSTIIRDNTVTSLHDVEIDSNGDLGYVSSSIRYKGDVQDFTEDNSVRIFDLVPKTFRYKKKDEDNNFTEDLEDAIQFGVIAEEAISAVPELVRYNDEGEIETFYYKGLIIPMLHQLKVQRDRISDLEKRVGILELA